MYHVNVTTTPPVTVVCTGASTATMTIMIAATSVRTAIVLVQNDVVLPPPLTLMDAVSGVAGFSVLLQQQSHPQMAVATQAYANYAMSPLQVSSPSELSLLLIFYVDVLVFVFYFLALIRPTFPPVGAQLWCLHHYKPFLDRYVPHDNGSWPIPGLHWVDTAPLLWVGECLILLKQLISIPSISGGA